MPEEHEFYALTRRQFMKLSGVVGAGTMLGGSTSPSNGGLSVKDYGAKGDGMTDDYAAIKRAVAAINTAGKGILVFPPGVYKIDQHKIIGGGSANTITDICFQNCNGLQVIGYKAVINVKGNFNRAADYTVGGFTYSYSESVVPFSFVNCSNFELSGFELNGSVNVMSRATGVTEGTCHGVLTAKCSNYTLRDLYIHHFATDGLLLGGDTTVTAIADKDVSVKNVRSLFNARQGVSVIQVRGAEFVGCEFSETGNSAGSYGSHAPGNGVDIEPNFNTPTVDVRTGSITFTECKFKNNAGSQFTAAYADKVQKIRLRACKLIAGTSTSTIPLVLSIDDGVIEDSNVDTGGQFVYPAWSSPFNPTQRTLMRNCEIRSTDKMLVCVDNIPVMIEGCKFICTATGARASAYAIYIQNTKCNFTRNYVFFPAASYKGAGTFDIAVLIQKVQLSRDNFFETDLNPGSSEHFATDYTGAKSVQNETFRSAGAANKGFRSNYNGTWDNTFPYSR